MAEAYLGLTGESIQSDRLRHKLSSRPQFNAELVMISQPLTASASGQNASLDTWESSSGPSRPSSSTLSFPTLIGTSTSLYSNAPPSASRSNHPEATGTTPRNIAPWQAAGSTQTAAPGMAPILNTRWRNRESYHSTPGNITTPASCVTEIEPEMETKRKMEQYSGQKHQEFRPDIWGVVAPLAYIFQTVRIHDNAIIPDENEPLLFDSKFHWDGAIPSEDKISLACMKFANPKNDPMTVLYQIHYPREHQPHEVKFILDVIPPEFNEQYPWSIPVFLETKSRIGYVGYNFTPLNSYVDLHVDRRQDTACTMIGQSEKLWLLWPPTPDIKNVFYSQASPKEESTIWDKPGKKYVQGSKIVNMAPHLTGGRIVSTTQDKALLVPAGWIHMVHTLTGERHNIEDPAMDGNITSEMSIALDDSPQHQQTLLFLRAQPIRPGCQERQAPPGQNARAWGRPSIAITPDAARAECLRLATPEALPLCLALPEQIVQAPSAARAECAARAVCSRPAPPEQNAHFRHSQRCVLASGAASAVCSRRALSEQNNHSRRSMLRRHRKALAPLSTGGYILRQEITRQ
ncbi:hypothetical protein DFP73DRAFT_591020 [Morchella snyderi]|nr:hypothetical protein DFP73DRAFT_591020 [Morchella snyderi]